MNPMKSQKEVRLSRFLNEQRPRAAQRIGTPPKEHKTRVEIRTSSGSMMRNSCR